MPGELRSVLVTALAVMMVAATFGATPAQAEVVEIQIGQFNMAGGNDDHGHKGDEAPDALVRSIENRDPAFVTVQEGCQDWLERLDALLPAYSVHFDPVLTERGGAPADCKHPSPFGNAIIYRDDLGIDTRPEGYSLGSPAGSEQRELLCVASAARRFVICSTHLSSGDSHEDRKHEAAEAKEILESEYAGYTTFLGGDLNAEPGEDPLDSFYHSGYGSGADGTLKEVDSPCRNVITERLLVLTPLPVFIPCRSGESTHGNLFTRKKIDYLFVSPDIHVRDADVTNALHSDHDPLWADITVDLDTPGGGGGGGSDPENHPPGVDAGPNVKGEEGEAVELDGSAFDREDSVTTRWTYTPLDGTDPGASCAFSAPQALRTTITCTDDGVYAAELTADDGVNPPVRDSALVRIANAAPVLTLTGPRPWQVFRAGTPVPLTAGFTDRGTNDSHTCEVVWDDGDTDRYAADGSCDRSHTFAAPGMYTIKVQVADDDGASDTAAVMVVVYDPDAGFVTGSGSFEGGRFALNPQYGPHDEGPAPGHGRLKATLPDLAIGSTALEWLVVTPQGGAAVKGVSGDHGFVAYVTDEPDRFRLVVWRLSDGPYPDGDTVHDNREGASYDLDQADPPPSGNGSIRIHR
ncbi:PKD domain-containing protein [Nonomuraea sp. NPDC048826]|uniref:PKD domain-containing protein n=1 Tax=Nonomuraea sp. NPDC048826 TaxID=3364347 RepID=UPI003717C2AC